MHLEGDMEGMAFFDDVPRPPSAFELNRFISNIIKYI